MELETRIFADGTLTFDEPSHKYQFIKNDGEIIDVRSVTSHFSILGSFNIGAMSARKGLREVFMKEIELNKQYSWQYKKDAESFIKDISKKSADVWKQASSRGTAVHATLENYAKGIQPTYDTDESIAKMQKAGIDWFDANVEKVLSSEVLVYNKEHNYSGKYDLECILNDGRGRVLLDWKTGSIANYRRLPDMSNKQNLQLLAYMECLLEQEGGNPFNRMVVIIDRDSGEIMTRTYGTEKYQRDKSIFLQIINLNNYFHDYADEWKQ
tara:strand:+ start:7003 stop:7806 length:804 start_codon:yes stop_codon:yes gene_type:complete